MIVLNHLIYKDELLYEDDQYEMKIKFKNIYNVNKKLSMFGKVLITSQIY